LANCRGRVAWRAGASSAGAAWSGAVTAVVTGVRVDTSKQRPGLGGAEIDFLEASEQCAALKHGPPTGVDEMKSSD
jgi:hypothetical protein